MLTKNKTAELLKGCTNQLKWEDVNANSGYSGCGEDGILCDICKSELKGRLDAFKEEVEWLNENSPRDQHEKLHPVYAERLASIQEEIKLIEEKI